MACSSSPDRWSRGASASFTGEDYDGTASSSKTTGTHLDRDSGIRFHPGWRLDGERVYLLEGTPGSGKTTIALQFLLEGAANGEPGLYITLSETAAELREVARSHNWSLDEIELFELISEDGLDPDTEQSILEPSEVELGETIRA